MSSHSTWDAYTATVADVVEAYRLETERQRAKAARPEAAAREAEAAVNTARQRSRLAEQRASRIEEYAGHVMATEQLSASERKPEELQVVAPATLGEALRACDRVAVEITQVRQQLSEARVREAALRARLLRLGVTVGLAVLTIAVIGLATTSAVAGVFAALVVLLVTFLVQGAKSSFAAGCVAGGITLAAGVVLAVLLGAPGVVAVLGMAVVGGLAVVIANHS